jgi:hypothetical protein
MSSDVVDPSFGGVMLRKSKAVRKERRHRLCPGNSSTRDPFEGSTEGRMLGYCRGVRKVAGANARLELDNES